MVTAEEMLRYADGNVRDGKHLAWKRNRLRLDWCLDEMSKPLSRRLLGKAKEFASAEMVGERRELTRLDCNKEHETRTFCGRLPKRSMPFEGRVRCLEVLI
jgi:hypothetical protein